ncbi:Type cbb3 cytochrome oxidase biogenesis protein CcoG, involved in Cu oxidation [hydrothermal vent metagenome]|uniref:Type cbb3 cytochrome oxidase biogenesis protein CcoG, involved in Cu oxidation n=1 Tax=hydrothermal vent metagenome TaxID=652676 RepID=A0A3B1A8B9_9ZZZZ
MNEESTSSPEQQRIAIYPRSVKGFYRKVKSAIVILAYSVYFLLPWLRWERENGPTQAVIFDINARRFDIFDFTLFAQDIFWLALFFAFAALLLFFVTGIAGRVFCGYFCFQTLWTDVFMHIEHWVQGERPARMKLAKSKWNTQKIFKIGLTHFLWLVVAFFTGLAFTLYWGNAPDLIVEIFTFKAPLAAGITILFLTLTTYVMAGIAREQVCTYMCPYARFQSAMFDSDTIIVAYDSIRGEGNKGRHKPSKELIKHDKRLEQGYGDCVDCGYCVQVCPTGIDIRNGLQYQCTTCALCIDACNTIMTSVGYPKGLIRYSSENEMQGGKTRIFKPKTIVYGLTLVVIAVIFFWGLNTRSVIDVSVRQVRQPLFVVLSNGDIQNRYAIKINNKTDREMWLAIALRGLDGAVLDLGRFDKIHISAASSSTLHVNVRMSPKNIFKENRFFEFVVTNLKEKSSVWTHEGNFFTPTKLLNKAVIK